MFGKLFGEKREDAQGSDGLPVLLAQAAMAWVDTCLVAMPNVRAIRDNLVTRGFRQEPDATACEVGDALAFEIKLVTTPVRDVHHTLWTGERQGAPVVLLLSLGNSDEGQIVFATALFGAAAEADGAKVIERLAMALPDVSDRPRPGLRRHFWSKPRAMGLRAMVLSGPDDPEARDQIRALIAFSKAA